MRTSTQPTPTLVADSLGGIAASPVFQLIASSAVSDASWVGRRVKRTEGFDNWVGVIEYAQLHLDGVGVVWTHKDGRVCKEFVKCDRLVLIDDAPAPAGGQNTTPLLPTFAAPMLAESPTFRVVATNTDGCYLVITRQYIYSADYAVFNSWDGRLYQVPLHGGSTGSYSNADTAELNTWEFNTGGWRQDYLKRSDIHWFTASDNIFLVGGQIVEGSDLRVEGEA